MEILIVGRGGREFALVKKSLESPLVSKIFVAPGSVGIGEISSKVELVNIEEDKIEELLSFAKERKIGLTIVGPELPLSLGIVNRFSEEGLTIFGPTKEAALIETSKKFAKEFMVKYDIPTAKFRTFDNIIESREYVMEMGAPIVIKDDGLRSGKGVTVATNLEEALTALDKIFLIDSKSTVVIEEYLDGYEFSHIALVNGRRVIPLELAKDHKRVYDYDRGPNTGGMGAYSPVASISKSDEIDSINKTLIRAAKGLVSEGSSFTGFLFAGVMLTSSGPKVIEYNARFGDPECEVILSRLQSDLISILLDILSNKDEIELSWDSQSSVGVVLANLGYPLLKSSSREITIPSNIDSDIYHMGIESVLDIGNQKKYLATGGRVLMVLAKGTTLQEAKEQVYKDISKIECSGSFYRRDIGAK